jgi:6-phosphogluconolactonase
MRVQTTNFYLGTYTQAADHVPDPQGKGIVSCTLNLVTGAISTGAIYPDIENPAWLDWQGSKLYAAFESFSGPSAIYQFDVESDQTLTLQKKAPCSGTSACHITHHADNLYSAAYVSGQLDVYSTKGDLQHLTSVCYQGDGPNSSRQQSAHAHQALVSSNDRWLYICDLGSDCIWRHELEHHSGTSKLGPAIKISTPAGTGPRHMVFHPDNQHAYLLTELTAELLTFQYNERTGDLKLVDRHQTLPTDYQDMPSAAAIAIHPSGRALYYSNRQYDTVSCYSIDDDGLPTLQNRVSSGGLEPRAIGVDPTGNWLLVANQNSNCIVSYKLDKNSGDLSAVIAHSEHVGTPVCVVFKK